MTVDETDLDWRNRDTYLSYMYKLDQKIFDLPEGGSLFLNMARVRHMDQEYAFKSVGALQCIQGEGPLKSKHLVIVQPNQDVLNNIELAVDVIGEAFIYLEEKQTKEFGICNLLKFRGKVVNSTYTKVLEKLLKEDRKFTPNDLHLSFKRGSVQMYAEALKELYGWGMICKVEESGKPGRPTAMYSAYWPEAKKFWPLPDKPIIWDVGGKKFVRPEKIKARTAA